MAILDNLSGFEFEDLMEDVFRELGYENVRQADRRSDEGRDVLMEEVVDGTRRAVIVECKHTASVGRPVVQKLHSAVATFDYDGPKRGMVVTTGRFSGPASEYVDRLEANDDPYPVELIDGADLREIADEIGLDLYNGRIEILCDETLRPYDPAGSVTDPVDAAFREVENIAVDDLPAPHARATFRPVVHVTARTRATFETSVGVIHRVDERSDFVVHADRGQPEIAEADVGTLVRDNVHAAIELDEGRWADTFDDLEVNRFGRTQTEYKNWAIERLQEHHTTTVTYTGDNNVTYEKTCTPNLSDISVQSIRPVYLPQLRLTTELQGYAYPFEHYAAGPSRVTSEDGIRRCVQCGARGTGETYTYCENCGSINCTSHTKTERLEGTPVCTGCAVTERFALNTKYFYDEDNLESFRAEYEAMSLHRKAMENVPLAAGGLVSVVLFLLWVVYVVGIA